MTLTHTASPDNITIMLVDDSAVIRGALANLLSENPAIKIVASVSNGEIAVQAAAQFKPDIIILDVEMPIMDGMTALPLIRATSPTSKIVMFSAMTDKGADITIKALALGAVECLVKPTAGRAIKGGEFHIYILNLINNLKPNAAKNISVHPSPFNTGAIRRQASTQRPEIIAIGSSTGGPQALFEVLKECGSLPIPIVITQHMPPKFTKILAEHITKQCGLDAMEAENGMPLQNGKAYIAKGGYHMVFDKHSDNRVTIRLDDGAPINYCKPAVDPMLDSLIEIYNDKILSIILTGMGHDGLSGCQKLAKLGGNIIAQDEKTSVVWGMPGAVARAGICSLVLPLPEIGGTIKRIALTGNIHMV